MACKVAGSKEFWIYNATANAKKLHFFGAFKGKGYTTDLERNLMREVLENTNSLVIMLYFRV